MTESVKGELTRITINLTPKGKVALDAAMGMTGDNMTDTIHRALIAYRYIVDHDETLFALQSDGSYHQIVLL